MSDKKKKNGNIWVVIGACVLIILLLVWLTMADLWGDRRGGFRGRPSCMTYVELVRR